jgi:hypothetical protein
MPCRPGDTAVVPLAPEGDRPSSLNRNRLAPVLGVAGCGLFVYLIVELGPATIAAHLQGLVAILPPVLVITGVKYPLQAAGWRLALPVHARPPWTESISATITGDALGYLTWAGPVTGEPARALLIRRSAPLASGVAAGAVERAIYHATAALLVWAVLLALFARAHRLGLVVALAGSAFGVAALVAFLRRRRRAPRTAGTQAGSPDEQPRAAGRTHRAVAAFLEAVQEIWGNRRTALPAIALLCLAQHMILVGEAYLILGALADGTSLRTAFVFEAITKIVNTAGILIPARVGVSEGGSALLADTLGFAASQGLSLALMRRVRALIWAGVGLALLPFQEARARSRP